MIVIDCIEERTVHVEVVATHKRGTDARWPQRTICHNLHGSQTGKCLAFSRIKVIDPDLALRRVGLDANFRRIWGTKRMILLKQERMKNGGDR